MTRETGSMAAVTMRALCALLLATSTGAAWAGTTVVYRCFDAHLGVVYTDLPCKDGEAFDTRAGDADAAAVARLEHVRDMLDQSAAQRISDERRAASQKQLVAESSPYVEQGRNDEAAYDYGAYGYAAGYPPLRPHRPRHHPVRPSSMHGAAPPPPYIVPRP